MLQGKTLFRPHFGHHGACIAADTMVPHKNKNGIGEIFFFGCRFHECFIGVIHISIGIHFLIGPEPIFLQGIFWKTAHFHKRPVFLRYRIRAVIVRCLYDSEKRICFAFNTLLASMNRSLSLMPHTSIFGECIILPVHTDATP